MKSYLLLAGLITIAGCATTSVARVNEAAAAKLAEYDRTGEVRNCLSSAQIDSIVAVDEKTLLIRSGVNDYYVSDLSSRCSGATGASNRFQYSTSTAQLCRNEIIQIVDNSGGFMVGACGMGSFEKLTKKPAAAETGR